MTYADLYAIWLPAHQLGLREISAMHLADDARVHVLPVFGPLPLEEITFQMLQNFAIEKSKTLASATVNKIFLVLKPSFAWAAAQGMLDKNPCERVKLPRVVNREIQVFSVAEIHALTRAASQPWLACMIELAWRTGLRRSEMFGLQWQDVDFSAHFLTVQRGVAEISPGRRVINPPKTTAGRRRILLDKTAIAVLELLRENAAEPWVFDEKLHPQSLTNCMRRACDKAGIPPRGFHALRHTHATLLLAAGVNPKVVQERLGHSSIAITLGAYGHALPTMQQAAVRVMEELGWIE